VRYVFRVDGKHTPERNTRKTSTIQRVYSCSSLYQTISRMCLSDERRFLYICNSVPPSRPRVFRVLPPFQHRIYHRCITTLSPSLSYPHPLSPKPCNSCTNVNAGRDGFTNCFSLPPATLADPFYVFFSFSSSFSFLSLSFPLFPFLSSPYT